MREVVFFWVLAACLCVAGFWVLLWSPVPVAEGHRMLRAQMWGTLFGLAFVAAVGAWALTALEIKSRAAARRAAARRARAREREAALGRRFWGS